MKNHWLYRIGRRTTIRELNRLLAKFVGRKTSPLDDLVADMRKEVLKYFKKHHDNLKYFINDGSLDYRFQIEERNGFVVSVEFEQIN